MLSADADEGGSESRTAVKVVPKDHAVGKSIKNIAANNSMRDLFQKSPMK